MRMEDGKLPSVRAAIVWACFELISGGVLWAVDLISPALMIAFGVLGLVGVFLYDRGRHRLIVIPALLAAASVMAAVHLKPPAKADQPIKSAVDPQGLCFVDFIIWHHDQKLALTTTIQNRNKQTVNVALMSHKLAIEGYPLPKYADVENNALYPEQDIVTFDSNVIELGKDFPPGTTLHGRVDFTARYGPTANDTALLRILGNVTIVVDGVTKGQDSLRWKADPESTPDCPGVDKLIGVG